MHFQENNEEGTLWSNIHRRVLVNIFTHPIEFARVLIRIGYEPIAPRPSRILFGKSALVLPNIFQYVGYIKSLDGFTGCYRGLEPRLYAGILSVAANRIISNSQLLNKAFPDPLKNADEIECIDDLPDKERRDAYIQKFIRDVICRVFEIIVSHPLDVITLRTMAQFIGGETKYNGIIPSLIEVYKENGFMGYYSGLAPRLIANVAHLAIVSTSTYFINKYIVNDRDSRGFTSTVMTFFATTATYPFLVVYHCMAVNNCGLAAGHLPQMPMYTSWLDCWHHLSIDKQLKRGNNFVWRYYTGPQAIINGKIIALDKSKFVSHN